MTLNNIFLGVFNMGKAKGISLEQKFTEMEAAELIERVDADQYEWPATGGILIGILEGIEEVQSSEGEGTYKRYTMSTDNGRKNFSIGIKYDKLITDDDLGKLFKIEFLGKSRGKGTKSVNNFKIQSGTLR
jgi:hypothetical protein